MRWQARRRNATDAEAMAQYHSIPLCENCNHDDHPLDVDGDFSRLPCEHKDCTCKEYKYTKVRKTA